MDAIRSSRSNGRLRVGVGQVSLSLCQIYERNEIVDVSLERVEIGLRVQG